MLKSEMKITSEISLDIEENRVLMPKGILGFDELRHYTLRPLEEEVEAVYWQLTSYDYPDISFILMHLKELHLAGMAIGNEHLSSCLDQVGVKADECMVFCIISIEKSEDGSEDIVSGNLRAPVVYHTITKQAWQVVLPDNKYPISLKLSID